LNDELTLQDAKNVAKGIGKACSKIGMGLALCGIGLAIGIPFLGLLSGDKEYPLE
tara:strand:- start:1009 stop:1173 length:165 start_codon:yes stop_codon:yes gene_type:complete